MPYADLMHEVSLRSGMNKMDATNLTIVLGPNLLKSSSPLRDVQMAGVSTAESTLGTVLRTCILRYYECFEDVPDRAEAVAPLAEEVSDASSADDSLGSSTTFEVVDADADDEEIDDAMLVMPLGPSGSADSTANSPPSAWGTPAQAPAQETQAPYKVRTRKSAPVSRTSTLSSATAARSLHTPTESIKTGSGGTVGKPRARSVVSIERGDGSAPGTMGRAVGSIRIGRGGNGTVRGKAAGAGVSAVGVTAAGFFAAPEDAPPVPRNVPR
jgi:Rho GTPase-activating protein 1